jgi:hypothetical protein
MGPDAGAGCMVGIFKNIFTQPVAEYINKKVFSPREKILPDAGADVEVVVIGYLLLIIFPIFCHSTTSRFWFVRSAFNTIPIVHTSGNLEDPCEFSQCGRADFPQKTRAGLIVSAVEAAIHLIRIA